MGKVTSGEDVVNRIAVVPRSAEDHPFDPIVIQKVSVAAS